MNRNGQAALEFLSTYGFAFLALFVVLGVISYTGIFNISSLRNNECRLPPGLVCRDFAFSQVNPNGNAGFGGRWNGGQTPPGVNPYMRFIVTNGYGVNVTINVWNMTDSITHTSNGCSIFNEQPPFVVFPWQPAENRTVYCPLLPTNQYFPTQRYDGSLYINFTQTSGAYMHNILGRFSMVAQ